LRQHHEPRARRVEDFAVQTHDGGAAMLTTVLIVLLILLLIGAIPSWPYSRGWGYGPSGILGIVLIVILILALTGRV
jgi:hypothetical protein